MKTLHMDRDDWNFFSCYKVYFTIVIEIRRKLEFYSKSQNILYMVCALLYYVMVL